MKYFNVWTSDPDKMMVNSGKIEMKDDFTTENSVINIFDDVRFQEILGFGGAFTEASAYNYSILSGEDKAKLIAAYFDPDAGLGYKLCRTHINSCDFSIAQYTYTDDNDRELKTFSIEYDEKYVIPFIRDAQKCAGNDISLLASPWSPPAWMKDSKTFIKGGKLSWDYAECWAEYFVKYIQEYKKAGIDISLVSIQNEPMATQTWESCVYTADDEARFAADYLAPALKKAGLGDVKIMVWDHNKERVYDRARDIFANEKATDAIWGVAFHWYSGAHFDGLDLVNYKYSDKKLIATEFCCGGTGGNYNSAFAYAKDMLGNLNHHMCGSIDWNMILDTEGGPSHDRWGGCQAPVTVDAKTKTFTLEPTYYAIAHFSRFIKKGAYRIGKSSFSDDIKVAAFQNPNGEIVSVMLNTTNKPVTASVRYNNQTAKVTLPAKGIVTIAG